MDPDAENLSWSEVEIARGADACWRLLCDVNRIPSWVPGVAAVRVLERDGEGRAARARFVGMPSRGSFAYTLCYDYDDGARTVRWRSEDEIRELYGEASIEEIGPDRCRLRYGLRGSATEIFPDWARMALHDESPEPVAAAFRRLAESGG